MNLEVLYNDKFYEGISRFYSFNIDNSINGVKRLQGMRHLICCENEIDYQKISIPKKITGNFVIVIIKKLIY